MRDSEKEHLRQLEIERANVDRLLLCLYPRPVIDRLKRGESLNQVFTAFDKLAEDRGIEKIKGGAV